MDGYAGKGHQVLLIDDDSEFCELMTDYLDVHSFAVSSVHTGTAGIEAARRQEYDVILLDMLLAGRFRGLRCCAPAHGNARAGRHPVRPQRGDGPHRHP